MREVSAAGRTFIEGFEGCSLTAYLCPAGVPTIGYGHTAGVKMGDALPNKDAADDLLHVDLITLEASVDRALGDAPTTQHQFDAMVSLAFNIGYGGFASSTVLRDHKGGNASDEPRAFGMWNKAMIDGSLTSVPGLTRRRAAEAAVYMTPEAAPHPMPAPEGVVAQSMPQAVEAPKPVAQSKSVVTGVVGGAAALGAVADQVQPALSAVQQASDAASGAATSMGGVKAALGSLIGGQALTIVLTAGAACCIGYVVWRYVQKSRRGEVVHS